MANWQGRHFFLLAADNPLRSWLLEPLSLTERCAGSCDAFCVRLIGFRGEKSLFPNVLFGRRVVVREVLLECDQRPVIFAHTELAQVPRGKLNCWVARLGSRSLGSLLFRYPGFKRGKLEFCRIDKRFPLFRRAIAAAGIDDCTELWARRSWHCLGRQCVLVTEVFLPQILELEKREGFRQKRTITRK